MNRRSALSLCALVALLACRKDKPGVGTVDFRHNRTGSGTKVATFGQDSITSEELTEHLMEMSQIARARYQTVEQKREFVDGLATFELFAAEAFRRGLHNDPEVVETAKKTMVHRLYQDEFDKKPTPVTDQEVSDYYEKHKSDFVKPEQVRLSHIFVAAATPEEKKQKRAVAVEMEQKAKKLAPMDFAAFGQLAKERSEEPRTKPLNGDMRYLVREDLAREYGPEVAAAADKLTTVGDIAPLVEAPNGFHILKLQGRMPALNLTLDQVRSQIQGQLISDKRRENFRKFVEELRKKANYQVSDEALAKVEVDLKAPAKEPSGPTPGFLQPPASPTASRTPAP